MTSSAVSLRGASFRFRGLFLSVLGWRVCFERLEQTGRDAGYLIDGSQKQLFVGFGRFRKTADFSNELKGSGSHFFGGYGRIEVEESFDVPTHTLFSR
jgi:hypothetical protein